LLLHTNSLKIVFLLLIITLPVYAHGANISWEMKDDSVHIEAMFDNGTPMGSAQVTVFSASAPTVVYTSGITDENGQFTFLPDKEMSLNWDVQARKAGHGDIIHFTLGNEDRSASVQAGFTTLQIILMSVSIVWGFIGTALFFASKKKETGNSAHP